MCKYDTEWHNSTFLGVKKIVDLMRAVIYAHGSIQLFGHDTN